MTPVVGNAALDEDKLSVDTEGVPPAAGDARHRVPAHAVLHGHLPRVVPGRHARVAEVQGGDAELARDIAMHIAASRPVCVDESGVPQEMLDKEKEIFAAQAATSGKPADIIEKMVSGRIRKFLAEVTLLGQPFVKDPDQSVEKLLKASGAKVHGFDRMELGEGVEKKTENFAEEVMAQVQGS